MAHSTASSSLFNSQVDPEATSPIELMNQNRQGIDFETLKQFGNLIQKLSDKIDSIDEKISKLSQQVEQIEDKLDHIEGKFDGEFLNLHSQGEYLVNRFTTEPFLCDPQICVDDLVKVKLRSGEEIHRLVQDISDEGVTVFDKGDFLTFALSDCTKIGHSPSLKYLIIRDIKEEDHHTPVKKKHLSTDTDSPVNSKRKL